MIIKAVATHFKKNENKLVLHQNGAQQAHPGVAVSYLC